MGKIDLFSKVLFGILLVGILGLVTLIWVETRDKEFPKDSFSIVRLEEPNFDGFYKKAKVKDKVNLELLSKSPNGITDDEIWLSKYGEGMTKRIICNFTPGGPQATKKIRNIVPLKCDGLYRRYVELKDGYNVIYYGPKCTSDESDNFGVDPTLIVITDPAVESVMYAFDFSKFSVSQYAKEEDLDFVAISVSDVEIENNILYACVYHSTYAESSSEYNGYLVAIDLRTLTLKWMSQPLTCNSSFLIHKDVIFTGYGFTNEDDYLYVLDKETGDRIYSRKLDKAPGGFSIIENTLYVRTYSLDYSFRIVEL
ncbi:MAG: hypothetical protein J6C46_00025 [Clostridia bacterium]|nr:hypothetical protein [Clostridia bacterium]